MGIPTVNPAQIPLTSTVVVSLNQSSDTWENPLSTTAQETAATTQAKSGADAASLAAELAKVSGDDAKWAIYKKRSTAAGVSDPDKKTLLQTTIPTLSKARQERLMKFFNFIASRPNASADFQRLIDVDTFKKQLSSTDDGGKIQLLAARQKDPTVAQETLHAFADVARSSLTSTGLTDFTRLIAVNQFMSQLATKNDPGKIQHLALTLDNTEYPEATREAFKVATMSALSAQGRADFMRLISSVESAPKRSTPTAAYHRQPHVSHPVTGASPHTGPPAGTPQPQQPRATVPSPATPRPASAPYSGLPLASLITKPWPPKPPTPVPSRYTTGIAHVLTPTPRH